MADEFDFGFTAVDETELGLVPPSNAPVQPPPASSEELGVISAKIDQLKAVVAGMSSVVADLGQQDFQLDTNFPQLNRVEEKIDRVLNMELAELNTSLQAQGQSISSILDEVEERAGMTRTECKNKLIAVEQLILPLLTNLMKNPEKPYIKWENRAERIALQIDKITALTRSFGV